MNQPPELTLQFWRTKLTLKGERALAAVRGPVKLVLYARAFCMVLTALSVLIVSVSFEAYRPSSWTLLIERTTAYIAPAFSASRSALAPGAMPSQ